MRNRIVLTMLACMLSINLSACDFKWNFEMIKDIFVVKPNNEKVVIDEVASVEEINESLNTTQESDCEFIFTPPKIDYVIEDTGTMLDYKLVKLYLGDGITYPVRVPTNAFFVTDNSGYIYARDNTFAVSRITGMKLDTFAESGLIRNAEKLSNNIIVSKSGEKGPQEAAILVANDTVLVVRAYDNPKAYQTLLLGFQEEVLDIDHDSSLIIDEKDTKILNKLPLYTGYSMTVCETIGEEIQRIYTYDTGSVTISRELRNFDDAKALMEAKLTAISGTNTADDYYADDNVLYVEIGDYVASVYRVNFNTCFTCFGYGAEAQFNVVKFLNAQSR